MNLSLIRLSFFHLCFASLTFGILLQQITHFLFFLISLYAACIYGLKPTAIYSKEKRWAFLFMVTILISAFAAQWRFDGMVKFACHWAFMSFWFVTPALVAKTHWVWVHRLMLLLSLPGLFYSYYWMVRPDEIAWALEKGFHMFPRAEGFVSNPITNAATLIIIACWSFGRLTSKVQPLERWLIWLHIGLSALIVIVSRVRVGIVGFLFLFLAVALFSEKLRRKTLWLLPIMVVLIAGSLYFFGFNMSSIEERLQLLINGFQLIKTYPIFGIGPDLSSTVVLSEGGIYGHPHNTLVGITAEMGFLGLAAYLGFIVSVGLAIMKLMRAPAYQSGPLAWLPKSLLLVYLTYWLIGMADYNFADTELLLAHSFNFAVAIILAAKLPAEAAPADTAVQTENNKQTEALP